jgi:hypothetical protein
MEAPESEMAKDVPMKDVSGEDKEATDSAK